MPRPHWPPRAGDRFFDATRQRPGLIAYGKVVRVEREWDLGFDEGRVTVQFLGRRVRYETAAFQWRGVLIRRRWLRVNSQRYSVYDLEPHERVSIEDKYVTYEFYELEGNWSSSEDGEGSWSIE